MMNDEFFKLLIVIWLAILCLTQNCGQTALRGLKNSRNAVLRTDKTPY